MDLTGSSRLRHKEFGCLFPGIAWEASESLSEVRAVDSSSVTVTPAVWKTDFRGQGRTSATVQLVTPEPGFTGPPWAGPA